MKTRQLFFSGIMLLGVVSGWSDVFACQTLGGVPITKITNGTGSTIEVLCMYIESLHCFTVGKGGSADVLSEMQVSEDERKKAIETYLSHFSRQELPPLVSVGPREVCKPFLLGVYFQSSHKLVDLSMPLNIPGIQYYADKGAVDCSDMHNAAVCSQNTTDPDANFVLTITADGKFVFTH